MLGWRAVCAVEFDGFCREVLMRRQRDGMLPLFPIWDDVRTFRKDNLETGAYVESLGRLARRGDLVVTGGFPVPIVLHRRQKGRAGRPQEPLARHRADHSGGGTACRVPGERAGDSFL